MKILLTVEDLRIGGAQTFVLRLAQALHQAGHTVHLYSHYAHYTNANLVRQLAPDVPVIAFGTNGLVDTALRKGDGLRRRLGLTSSWREKKLIEHLRRTIKSLQPDVVNTHTIKADYAAAKALQGLRIPLVITMHGCYELFLHKADSPEVTPQGNYALQHAAGLVYLTEKNLEIFSVSGARALASLPHAQIYNGFAGQFSAELPTRAQLGIGARDLVFGMVARGIKEKGWEYAISSFEILAREEPQVQLILVGESTYLNELREAHPHPRIHFVGFSSNPIDWVRLFDVGLLPSYFASESLPNSIAEYLFCDVPVVATRIGEIPQMLEVPGHVELAGILLEQTRQGLTDPEQLTIAMRSYLAQPTLLTEQRALARKCFDKFRMERCVAAYEGLYEQVSLPGIAAPGK